MGITEMLLRYVYILFIPGLASAIIMFIICFFILRPLENTKLLVDFLMLIITYFNIYLVVYLGAYTYLFETKLLSSSLMQDSVNHSIIFKIIVHLPLFILLFGIASVHFRQSKAPSYQSHGRVYIDKWRDAINFNRSLNFFICFSYAFFLFFPRIINYIFPKCLIDLAYCF